MWNVPEGIAIHSSNSSCKCQVVVCHGTWLDDRMTSNLLLIEVVTRLDNISCQNANLLAKIR